MGTALRMQARVAVPMCTAPCPHSAELHLPQRDLHVHVPYARPNWAKDIERVHTGLSGERKSCACYRRSSTS